jgi:hypothetical protein
MGGKGRRDSEKKRAVLAAKASASAGAAASGGKERGGHATYFRAAPSGSVFYEGCRATLVRLDSKAGNPLNGKSGVVGSFDPDTGRWAVKLDGNDSSINCRPINCRPINMELVAEIPYFDSAGKLVGHKASIESYTLANGAAGWTPENNGLAIAGHVDSIAPGVYDMSKPVVQIYGYVHDHSKADLERQFQYMGLPQWYIERFWGIDHMVRIE